MSGKRKFPFEFPVVELNRELIAWRVQIPGEKGRNKGCGKEPKTTTCQISRRWFWAPFTNTKRRSK
jgi:hypothetical protein